MNNNLRKTNIVNNALQNEGDFYNIIISTA